jgi:outer membrane protein OmpA-like peptidoglycan-associated protein
MKTKNYPRLQSLFKCSLQVIYLGFLALDVLEAQEKEQTSTAAWGQVEALQGEAQAKRADLLSPDAYAAAQKARERAQADAEAGKNPDRISRSVLEAQQAYEKAIANADLVSFTFPDLVKAYDDALTQKSPEFAAQSYLDAEKTFKSAISAMEEGDLAAARLKAPSAETLLRQAELEAIQAEIVGEARDLLRQAQDAGAPSRAPLAFKESQEAIRETESFISADRYNKSEARELAERASYLCRRASFRANWISALRKDDANWELLVRQFESELADVGSTLQMNLEFDQDFDLPAQAIQAAIRSLQVDRAHLQQELTQRDDQIGQLEAEVGRLKTETGKYVAELEVKRQELERRKRIENKIEEINANFKPEEGIVLQQGERVILRLNGLRFNSGSSTIRSENFPLLTRAQQAIREFPEYRIEIQGHTDSQGEEQENLELSQKRAEAVRTYLLQNLNLSAENITAVGFGESQPVASNEGAAGRTANRRIEIVLTP